MDTQSVDTAATNVTYDGRLLTISSNGVHSTRASVDETLRVARELVGDTRGPMLFDARRWPGGDAEGWASVIASIGELFSTTAMLVSEEMVDEIGPFPDAIDRLVIPFKIFTDESEAKEFLDDTR